MTHAEACTALRGLAWRVRFARLPLEEWADLVAQVIAQAYPDATSIPPALAGAPSEPPTAIRTSTAPDTRRRAASPPRAADQSLAAVPA